MNRDIVLIAHFGDQEKEVTLSQPNGSGGAYYHIIMDRYYHGQVVKTSEGWKAYIHRTSILSYEDGQILCEIAERECNQ